MNIQTQNQATLNRTESTLQYHPDTTTYCRLSFGDALLDQCDQMLKTLHGITPGTGRPTPQANSTLSNEENQSKEIKNNTNYQNHTNAEQRTARLMRVNHCGEIMAQALYFGQILTAGKNIKLIDHLIVAANEEADHLRWCHQRIQQLGGKTSLANPIWYTSAFALGACAGLLGKHISLGVTAEVEKQVHAHLQKHIDSLPYSDNTTRAILIQMQTDELQHRENALNDGGQPLPTLAQKAMQGMAKIMTSVSYWL